MSDRQELTPAQQRAAVGRIRENLALRSGAGCGKTFVLARRFTELLMDNPASADPLSRFVALTFTDKAAVEMAQRVRRLLTARVKGSKGQDRKHLLGWLQELSEARISTIHSFCASLLRSSAIQAGLDADFAVCADQLLTGQMVDEAAERAVLQAVEHGHTGATMLLSRLMLETVCRLVAELIDKRTSADPNDYRDPSAILAHWDKQAAAQRDDAWAALKADHEIAAIVAELERAAAGVGGNDKLAQFIGDRLSAVRQILADPASATLETLAAASTSAGNLGSAGAWGGKEQLKEVRRQIKELGELVGGYAVYAERPGQVDRDAAEGLAALTELAGRANALYAAAKRARGILDFTDLLEATDRLLKEDKHLARTLGGGIGQLLVDECQDTDAFQVRLLERLIRGGDDRAAIGEGKLFVVGDAKQSIYRFRGAQVEVFQDWCGRLGGDRQENLDLSYRTHAAAAAFVNHLFAPLMGADYATIRAKRSQCPPRESAEIILASGLEGGAVESAAQAVAAQAAAAAERIEQMVAGGEKRVWDDKTASWRAVRYGDVAVLFARMTQSLEFERALAQHDIPYYVIAGSGFFRQQEVFDVLNVLRAIDNPFDDVALVGVLRGSLFGLDDEALLRIAMSSRPPYWPDLSGGKLPEGLDESSRQAIDLACRTIARLHRDKDSLGIDRIIDEVLAATCYEATLLAQPQGRRMLGNVRLLLDQARSAAAEGLSLADFVARMDDMVLNQSRYEQAAVSGEAEDVVRLMTIHKAKGLEFPVVVVPDLNYAPRGERGGSLLLHRSDWGVTLKLKPGREGDSPKEQDEDGPEEAVAADTPLSYRLAKLAEHRDQEAEDIRKLYVAVTRAKDHIVLVGANWRGEEGSGPFRMRGSFLCRIDEVLKIHQAADGGASAIPYGDGRFKAALKVVTPSEGRTRHARSRGEKLLAAAANRAELAKAMSAAAPKHAAAPPLLGELPVATARAELAVTALNDFARCPMLFQWRYELRVDGDLLAEPSAAPPSSPSPRRPTDPAAAGTLFHLCMEMLDFQSPQPARSLVTAAACRLQSEDAIDTEALAADFARMLEAFTRHPLLESLRSARAVLRELDFVAAAGPATLRGKIDLLYQDAAGDWRIVDYKSDRVDERHIPEHAAGYELQMLAYAAAAARHLGRPPKEAVLYFLRPACAHVLALTPQALATGEGRLAELAGQLVAARRSGRFQRRGGELCSVCSYRAMCLRDRPAGY